MIGHDMEFHEVLAKVLNGESLTREEMTAAFHAMMTGEAEDVPMAAFLAGLRVKGETPEEIAAAAQTMRSLAPAVNVSARPLIDTCGTGGSGSNIFNVSSAAAIVAAAAGVKIAKHGNRAVSGSSGSADALECLGVAVDLDAQGVATCLEKVGIAFLFARKFHGAMRHVAPVRQALGTRTIFNLLGPLTNPAHPNAQVIGVFDRRWQKPLARVTNDLGISRALVVHAEDGLDEISIATRTHVVEQRDGVLKEWEINPDDLGLRKMTTNALRVSGAKESAKIIERVLAGDDKGDGAYDMTVLNAAAAIFVADVAPDMATGITLAQAAIADGAAQDILKNWVAVSQKCKKGVAKRARKAKGRGNGGTHDNSKTEKQR